MFQNEKGTWHREDLAGHIPPLEARFWVCSDCLPKVDEYVKEQHALGNRCIICMDRVADVAELHLKTDVACLLCDKEHSNEKNVHVETY